MGMDPDKIREKMLCLIRWLNCGYFYKLMIMVPLTTKIPGIYARGVTWWWITKNTLLIIRITGPEKAGIFRRVNRHRIGVLFMSHLDRVETTRCNHFYWYSLALNVALQMNENTVKSDIYICIYEQKNILLIALSGWFKRYNSRNWFLRRIGVLLHSQENYRKMSVPNLFESGF